MCFGVSFFKYSIASTSEQVEYLLYTVRTVFCQYSGGGVFCLVFFGISFCYCVWGFLWFFVCLFVVGFFFNVDADAWLFWHTVSFVSYFIFPVLTLLILCYVKF